jgi:tripartite-type tricarboxylate transporter receptor subunit TctC
VGAPAFAQNGDVEKFYAGRNVDFLVGSAPGGGYAIYANLLSRHFGRHIPGNPRVVARTVEGAGSLTAANQIYTTAPRDGSVFGAVFTGAIVEPLIGDRAKARYDSRKFGLIGSANRETSVCFARKDAGVTSWKDVFERRLIVAGAGWASLIRQFPAVLNKVLGTKFEIVSGYPGSKEAVAAVEKGEAQGVCGIQWSSFGPQYGEWIAKGDVVVFGQIAAPPGDALQNARGVQNIWDVVRDAGDRRVLEVIFDQSEYGRPYIAPPGVPPARLEALRRAFDATMKDPEFLADAERGGLPIGPMTGEEFQSAVDKLYEVPEADVSRAKAALD